MGVFILLYNNNLHNQKIIEIKGTYEAYIDSLSKENIKLSENILDLEDSISNLETDLNSLKKTKIKLVESIKYIEPVNDTIEKFIVLNELNDSIIRKFEVITEIKDTIISKQNRVISNQADEIIILKRELVNKDAIIRQEKNKKII